MIKNIFVVGVIALSLVFSGTTSFAEESSEPTEFKTDEELDLLRESGKDFTVVLTDEQAVERAAELAEDDSIEILDQPTNAVMQRNTVKSKNHFSRSSVSTNDMSEESATTKCNWIETLTTVTVSSSYKPKLSVIVKGCRSGSFSYLNKKVKPMFIGFVADNKEFAGTIRVEIDNDGFLYLANGKFANHAEVTHEGTSGITTIFTATYSFSNSSNFYKSLYTGLKYRQVL
ncbi:hypothetical protein [Exiguobacterium sp. R-17]|uniref:hypothetical protein n=1 Tax=Exiguobacterium sp. R-17 TaxID=3404054 RepID=UPI003CFB30BF